MVLKKLQEEKGLTPAMCQNDFRATTSKKNGTKQNTGPPAHFTFAR